jgi:hypothetical protein
MSKALIAAAGAAVVTLIGLLRHRRRRVLPVSPPLEPPEDPAARRARREEAQSQGEALLERRVMLDARRGTLGGDMGLNEALEVLDGRRQRGEISDDEFEREKVRLLTG